MMPAHKKPPYAVILFALGGVIGAIVPPTNNELGPVEQTDPHVILFLLLPPLLFHSSWSIDSHVFKVRNMLRSPAQSLTAVL
jgi:NhaP-type Na+/H+ or K+/H+ antiporter